MAQLLFRNFQLLEPEVGELQSGCELLLEGETVRECADKPIKSAGADVIDCGGRTLMPGLIDSHVHVMLSEVNIRFLEAVPLTLMILAAPPDQVRDVVAHPERYGEFIRNSKFNRVRRTNRCR